MKRLLLTGATGFVGANLARFALGQGHEVHLLVRPQHQRWRIAEIAAQCVLHEVDLLDAQSVDSVLSSIRPHWVFHLAAYGAYSSQMDVRRMISTNLVGTVNLVEASLAAEVEAFVHAGSSSEYGYKSSPPREDTWVEPNSHYAVTKVSATHYCRHMAVKHQTRIITLRLYSVYGPYEEPTRLIPTLIISGLKGRLPPLVNPDIARDYVYVDDVSRAFLQTAFEEDQPYDAVYNVGTGVQTTLRQVVATAQDLLPIVQQPQWGTMPDRAWDTSAWVADIGTIRDVLGWSPQFTLKDGMLKTIEWFDANPVLLNRYAIQRDLPR